MKKALLVFFVITAVLFLTPVVSGRGELGDMDAYQTYFGKTRSEVRRISPEFEEIDDDFCVIDSIDEDGELIALAVIFDDYDLVESVVVLVSPGAMRLLDLDTDIQNAAVFGIFNLGFDTEDLIRSITNEDGDIISTFTGGITVITTTLEEGIYASITHQQ